MTDLTNQIEAPQRERSLYEITGDILDINTMLIQRPDLSSLRAKVTETTSKLERESLRLAACSVVAMADTPESAKEVRAMHPDYESASCDDVKRRVDECIELRSRVAELEAQLDVVGAGGVGPLMPKEAAMKQALEALYDSVSDNRDWIGKRERAVTALRQAIEADHVEHDLNMVQQPEPVAWKHDCDALCMGIELWIARCPHCGKPRSTHPQPAQQPNGTVLVPKRMTTAMRRVTDQEGWTWEDLLAAAEAITEDEHADLGRSQQQAKPVYQLQRPDGLWRDQDKQAFDYNASHGWPTRILYTHPQPAQWVGLTDDDIDPEHPFIDSIRAIEAKLREKNAHPQPTQQHQVDHQQKTSNDEDLRVKLQESVTSSAPAAAPQSAGIPPGWKLVPVEPTREMLDAARSDLVRDGEIDPMLKKIHAAMLAAAPEAPAQQPLTDEQIDERWEWVTGRAKKHRAFARSIEREIKGGA